MSNCNSSVIKKYRKLLNISQKEAACGRLSHSMISLIESGKAQLTTVTAMILSDNFNKIAAEKGIELNLTLKDLLVQEEKDYENEFKKDLMSLEERGATNAEYDKLLEKAKQHNCFEVMGEIEKLKGSNFELKDNLSEAIESYNKAYEYFKLIKNQKSEVEVLLLLVKLYNDLNQFDKAENYLNKIKPEKINKSFANTFLFQYNIELLKILVNTNRNEEGLKIIEVLSKSRKFTSAQKKKFLLFKGIIYIDQKNYSGAVRVLKPIAHTSGTMHYLIYHKLAIAYFLTGSINEGLNCINQCINYLSTNSNEKNTKIIIKLAEEFNKYGIDKYSTKYFDYALENCELYGQKDYKLICYKSLFNIFYKRDELDLFQKYAVQIEKYLLDRKGKSDNLTEYVLLIVKYCLKTSKEVMLERFIDTLEKLL
ncbi:hypothetical protein N3C_0696 [Clostridium sp. N3C]|uniref:helix-turn-helix domain-containing protein n=1 Tax=Clostridium sp. N3C TaxID=1776758 RepID=UPI00092E05EC|nr:helix-turn-helix transcriptional regulator [Clostridium sp. N3C]SCN22310.1 hypothetical protein N3C_0696 [Clostridium sp. N3C]